jgi:hypothetical protein
MTGDNPAHNNNNNKLYECQHQEKVSVFNNQYNIYPANISTLSHGISFCLADIPCSACPFTWLNFRLLLLVNHALTDRAQPGSKKIVSNKPATEVKGKVCLEAVRTTKSYKGAK